MNPANAYPSALLLLMLLLIACQANPQKSYAVKKTERPVQMNGKGSDPVWETAHLLTDFSYPWRNDPVPETTFRALWSDQYFYFLFQAVDPEIITPQRGLGERDAVNSDRVEIFFKVNDDMDPYYALEMDALGRLYDSKSKFHRNIDAEWDWPENHLTLMAAISDVGYTVEGAISLESLRQLGVYHDDQILKAGVFRGEYLNNMEGQTEVRWISWIIPDAEKPDFHIPSSFGELRLLP